MPLPTIDLDTRRYPDLVDEARSLVPRYAPAWTDFNASDPGITLLELFAYLTEQVVYRTNRVPDSHRRRFLALVGFPPEPPRAAHALLTFRPSAGGDGLLLPAGLAFGAGGISFRTTAPLTLSAASLIAVQVFDGSGFTDVTRLWRDGVALDAFGPDPSVIAGLSPGEQPALYLCFDGPLPATHETALALFSTSAKSDSTEGERIEDEAAERAAACAPLPLPTCADDDAPSQQPDAVDVMPLHHSLRTEWDVHDGSGWRTLDPTLGEIDDQTRSLTLDGIVRIRPPAPMIAVAVGQIAEPRFTVRCRLAGGSPDAALRLRTIAVNAVDAEQRTPARQTFVIVAGAAAPAVAPVPGTTARLSLGLDRDGSVVSIALDVDPDAPETTIVDYRAATAISPGALTVTLVQAGRGSGGPEQSLVLDGAPVADGAVALWTLEGDGPHLWTVAANFDAAGRHDEIFTLDAETGNVTFGDGLRGRVPPEGAPLLARYDTTLGSGGNVAARGDWSLSQPDAALNRALLGADPATAQQLLASVASLDPATGGAEAETTAHAAGRAAARLWSHEQLIQACTDAGANTLDQLDRNPVLALTAPERAATLLDFERLALDVPGTIVGRARAFGAVDGRFPDLLAPGTVTVVVVAGVPAARPVPSQALLDTIAGYLARRKVLGTRLVVVGPTYVEVSVDATLEVARGADPTRVQSGALASLAAYLDPLTGGPLGRGWPFGRDVYRSEMLQLLAAVDGVECVSSLTLTGPDGESCGNVCIPATGLPVTGSTTIGVAA